jgi:hypothetical protein
MDKLCQTPLHHLRSLRELRAVPLPAALRSAGEDVIQERAEFAGEDLLDV